MYKQASFQNKEQEVTHDMEYFFCYSTAECFISSSWTSCVNQSCFGPPQVFNDSFSDAKFDAIDKLRKIEKTYFQLSHLHQNILYASFSGFILPRDIVTQFSKYAATAFCFHDYKILCSIIKDKDKTRLIQLRVKCETEYKNAINIYFDLKRSL